MKLLVYAIIAVLIYSCNSSSAEQKPPTSSEIINSFYNKPDTSIILKEEYRKILDTVVVELTRKNESPESIQRVVDNFKSQYGEKKKTTQ